MKEYRRDQYNILEGRLKGKRKLIQVLTGPRQVGKTTLIRQVLNNISLTSTYISADGYDARNASWIEKHWESARANCRQSGKGHLLAIDEIQKIPDWSPVVKKLWDEDTYSGLNLRLVLSGSSGLLIHRGLNESLAGRFEIIHMRHWSYQEMNKAFSWKPEQYAWFGGYPGSAELINDEDRWKRYIADSLVESTISKDILMLTRIEKPALLKRLFELGCLYSGQILSYTKMLGQLQNAGNTVTLAHYLNLLDTAGLLTGIEKYSGSVPKQKSSSPKFLVQNTALLSSGTEMSFKEALKDPVLWGRIVESAVGAHLVNISWPDRFNIYYWREGNDEVDYVIQKGQKIVALEIKSGRTQKWSGLDRFKQKHPAARIVMIGNNGIPWQTFIGEDPVNLLDL